MSRQYFLVVQYNYVVIYNDYVFICTMFSSSRNWNQNYCCNMNGVSLYTVLLKNLAPLVIHYPLLKYGNYHRLVNEGPLYMVCLPILACLDFLLRSKT